MLTLDTTPGSEYIVKTAAGCDVFTPAGQVMCRILPGIPGSFQASGYVTCFSDVAAEVTLVSSGTPGGTGGNTLTISQALDAANRAELAADRAAAGASDAELQAQGATVANTAAQAALAGAQAAKANAEAAAQASATSESNATAAAERAATSEANATEASAAAAADAAEAEASAARTREAAWPAVMVLLRDELLQLVGEGRFDLDRDGEKIVVHTDRLGALELAAVNEMLARFVPAFLKVVRYNHDISIPWQEIPEGFTVVEYLESVDKQYIEIPIVGTSRDTIIHVAAKRDVTYMYGNLITLRSASGMISVDGVQANDEKENGIVVIGWRIDTRGANLPWPQKWTFDMIYTPDTKYTMRLDGATRNLYVNEELKYTFSSVEQGLPEYDHTGIRLMRSTWADSNGLLYSFKYIKEDGEVLLDIIPCLDKTGTPCMVNRVTRTPYYNLGTGDFLYPGKEEESATFSLRRPITYAQLTEHGVRRLYHVPKDYNGTKEEYAVEFGWKPLVETPAPEEGYWAPEWRETEDEIVLEWVETEQQKEYFAATE